MVEAEEPRCCCYIRLRTGAIWMALLTGILGFVALLSILKAFDFPNPNFKGSGSVALICVLDIAIISLSLYLLIAFYVPCNTICLVPALFVCIFCIIACFIEALAYGWIPSTNGFAACMLLDVALAYLFYITYQVFITFRNDTKEEEKAETSKKKSLTRRN